MRKLTRNSLVSAAAAALLVAGATSPAMAAGLTAYNTSNGTSCSGVLTTGSSASYIDVADNLTSCVDNATSKQYNGMNIVGPFAFEVFSFSAGSWTYNLGGANDIIDHFDED